MSREPVNDDELRASIQLSMVEGIGPRRFAELISWCGSACQVLELSHAQLKELSPVVQQQLTSLHSPANQARAGEILEHCQGSGTRILLSHFDDYPALLREIHDPPPLLYVRGDRLSRDDLSLAIVGTRFASPYGLEIARRLSTAAAQAGFTVVSGLARGIDGAAHEAALLAGGRTIAVLGSGVERIYPAEHRSLADQVTNAGMLISEFPPLARPTAAAFPRRNRVISGISLGVIVVEAPQRSGALITARLALEQGREVFAVPGPVDQASSRGCHQLLRDGAVLVECLGQVIEELGPLAQSATDREGHRVVHPAELDLNELERTVLDAIGNRPTSIDQLIRSSELSTPQVLATLSALEVRLLISRQAGQMVIRR